MPAASLSLRTPQRERNATKYQYNYPVLGLCLSCHRQPQGRGSSGVSRLPVVALSYYAAVILTFCCVYKYAMRQHIAGILIRDQVWSVHIEMFPQASLMPEEKTSYIFTVIGRILANNKYWLFIPTILIPNYPQLRNITVISQETLFLSDTHVSTRKY